MEDKELFEGCSRKLWESVGAVVGTIGFVLLKIWLVMLVWNWVIPDIFHLPEITFGQSFGLAFICCNLFCFWPKTFQKDED